MKKILLLTDFSEASKHALDFARAFFGDTVANFHLLCVYPPEFIRSYNPIYSHEASRTAYDDQLNDIVTTLRQEATTDWHTFRSLACPGVWIDVIERALKAETYDFVVMGSQKDGTNELFGTSAIALTRQLKANVLVVPVDALAGAVRRVVLATDFARMKNAKLLGPVKDLIVLKGSAFTLLTIDVPDKNAIQVEQELHIRTFLKPIEPIISRIQALNPSEGIDTYLVGSQVDLLVMIPNYKDGTDTLTWESKTYTPAVPVLTLYDDGSDDRPQSINDRPQSINERSNTEYA